MTVRRLVNFSLGCLLFAWVLVTGNLFLEDRGGEDGQGQGHRVRRHRPRLPGRAQLHSCVALPLSFCTVRAASSCSTKSNVCVGPTAPGVIPCSCSPFSC